MADQKVTKAIVKQSDAVIRSAREQGLSTRVSNILFRAYHMYRGLWPKGVEFKPVGELHDGEFVELSGVGYRTLDELRQFIPGP